MYFRLKAYRKFLLVFISAILIVLLYFIPASLTIAQLDHPIPDTILTLGGGLEREVFTSQFAQLYPEMDIWISTGIPDEQAQEIFKTAKIADTRINLDRRATDTVTNFTSLVRDFKQRHIHHVYLITSDFHMRRAKAIAFFVLGSQGIAFTPIPVPSDGADEPLWKMIRDMGRSLLWIITGRTGASLHPLLRQ